MASSMGPNLLVEADHRLYMGKFQNHSEAYPKDLILFHGIPYADVIRFHTAIPLPARSDEVLDNTERAASQPSLGAPEWEVMQESPLTLDLVVPRRPADPQRLMPVVVFFHGGCFNFGGPEERDLASFAAWARDDMIVVGVRYRLGVLGFCAGWVDELRSAENLGLSDQMMAVKWVRKTIGAFGGDGEDICLQGQSAGAHAVGHHMIHPNPLPFRKAILESGSPTARAILDQLHSRTIAQHSRLLSYARKGVAPLTNRDLTTLPIAGLLRQADRVWAKHESSVTWPFQPVVDGPGGFVPDLPLNSLANVLDEHAGHPARNMAVLMGFCSHEGTVFVPRQADSNADFLTFFAELLPTFSADDLEALEALYPDPMTDDSSPYHKQYTDSSTGQLMGKQFHRLHEAYGHYAYICPILHMAHVLSAAGARLYVYESSAFSLPLRAASHGTQADVVAHDMAALRNHPGLITVAGEMNRRWAYFIGAPDGHLPSELWPRFKTPFGGRKGTGEMLVFGEGNDEKCGGVNRGFPVGWRILTPREIEQCFFWWERMELSQGMGRRGEGAKMDY